jgi:hypothetical protein
MEDHEDRLLANAPVIPLFWTRYVDDVFSIWDRNEPIAPNLFLDFANKSSRKLKFTMEVETNNSLPFLDANNQATPAGYDVTVFRKQTHSNRYLNFLSHHPSSVKSSVVKTLKYRAQRVCSNENNTRRELSNLREAFRNNGYPDRYIKQILNSAPTVKNKVQDAYTTITIPYIKGLSEKLHSLLKRYGIRCVMKATNTLGSMLMKRSPTYSHLEKKDVVYSIPCHQCNEKYVGQTARHLGIRVKEHQAAVTRSDLENPIALHHRNTGHLIDWPRVSILDSHPNLGKRICMETFYMRNSNCFHGTTESVPINNSWNRIGNTI